MKVRWLSLAADDLEHLYHYIAEDDQDAAANEMGKVLQSTSMLGEMAGLGRPGRVHGTRELIVSKYIVVYRVSSERVEVLRVLHQARQWPAKT